MLSRVFSIMFALALVGCGWFPKEKSKKHESRAPDDDNGAAEGDSPETETGTGGDGTADGSEDERDAVSYDLWLVVREPGKTTTDTAALFVIKSPTGKPTVTNVSGPKFLGNAKVGVLDAAALDKLFVGLSSPLPKEAKDKLLEKYAGASIVYFDNYEGRLCSGGQYRLEFQTDYAEVKPLASFDFVGSAGQDGNCFFNSLSVITSSQSTK